MTDELTAKQVVRRLDLLISILLDSAPAAEAVPTAAKIQRLTSLGLSPAETASVLGKPTNYVTASLAGRKKLAAKRARPR